MQLIVSVSPIIDTIIALICDVYVKTSNEHLGFVSNPYTNNVSIIVVVT